jgi:hypothetical protein
MKIREKYRPISGIKSDLKKLEGEIKKEKGQGKGNKFFRKI